MKNMDIPLHENLNQNVHDNLDQGNCVLGLMYKYHM